MEKWLLWAQWYFEQKYVILFCDKQNRIKAYIQTSQTIGKRREILSIDKVDFARKDVFERSSILCDLCRCRDWRSPGHRLREARDKKLTLMVIFCFHPSLYIIWSSYPSSIHIVWVALSFLIHSFICKRFSWEGFCRKSRTRNLIYDICDL